MLERTHSAPLTAQCGGGGKCPLLWRAAYLFLLMWPRTALIAAWEMGACVHTQMLAKTHSSIIFKWPKWKPLVCPSSRDQTSQGWTIDCYSVTQGNKVQTCYSPWLCQDTKSRTSRVSIHSFQGNSTETRGLMGAKDAQGTKKGVEWLQIMLWCCLYVANMLILGRYTLQRLDFIACTLPFYKDIRKHTKDSMQWKN